MPKRRGSYFAAEHFTGTEWSTPEDKARFANQFAKLVTGGFLESHFPHWFYRRLSNCFGHIAHFDRHGFYSAQLATPERRLKFLRQATEVPIYGDPAYTYADVERAIRRWLVASTIMEDAERAAAAETQRRELAMLNRLQQKYGGMPQKPPPRTDEHAPSQFVLF